MTLQYSTPINNARLDAIETVIGASAKLRVYTGSMPANTAAAATGTVLVEMQLPVDWLGASASNVKSKLGAWAGTAIAAGTAGYFRILDNAGTTAGIQGVCGLVSGDLSLDNNVIAINQPVTVTSFSITAAHQ